MMATLQPNLSQLLAKATTYWLWIMVLAVAGVAFFASPGDYAATSHAILHGLCAQTPTHTIVFGDAALPFDARMTGIYGGFLVTVAAIIIRGGLFRYGNPPLRVAGLLAVLVLAMAVDGVNSLLSDLGLWHPYVPSNALRVVTGYGAGVTLAIALSWLLASSAWNLGSPTVAVGRMKDLVTPLLGLAIFGGVLVARPGWLHLPVSLLLVASAWLTVTMLVLVIVLLALKLDARVRTMDQLHVPVAISALLAISVMLALAGARFWAERTFGISNAMM